jgi:hypothetical protein
MSAAGIEAAAPAPGNLRMAVTKFFSMPRHAGNLVTPTGLEPVFSP